MNSIVVTLNANRDRCEIETFLVTYVGNDARFDLAFGLHGRILCGVKVEIEYEQRETKFELVTYVGNDARFDLALGLHRTILSRRIRLVIQNSSTSRLTPMGETSSQRIEKAWLNRNGDQTS
jgi:hypothetical protein